MDPSIKWYVRPSLEHRRIIRGTIVDEKNNITVTTNGIMYSCDDAICVPRYFGGYMSWYDPSKNGVGNRMFNLIEAWDHDRWKIPSNENPKPPPYDGRSILIPGYGGYFLGLHLTDGQNKVQVNIIHRYIDGSILIYNTGKDGDTTTNISVIVYDPPSGLGYNVQTNGTRGTGQTTLQSGQYVLFYKGNTPPQIDATTGIFMTSPFGVNKTHPYELWVNSYKPGGINIPKMYLGVKGPGYDMEVASNGAYPGVYVVGDIDPIFLSTMGCWGGADARNYPYGSGDQLNHRNTSRLIWDMVPSAWIYKDDPYTVTWAGGGLDILIWFGWGEDDNGNVKFILVSHFAMNIDTTFNDKIRKYIAYIYDVDRGEAYVTYIVKPSADITSYGEIGATHLPLFVGMGPKGKSDATMFAYIDANDTWQTPKDWPSSTWNYYGNAYGFCNIYTTMINCAEGLGIYTDDPNYTPPAPKSAFGAARWYGEVGAYFVRVPSLGDRTLYAGRIYAVVIRKKTFPAGTAETDLQNWFKSLQPRSLTTTDFNAMLNVLPGSFWFFNELTDTVTVNAPSSVTAGSQFSVNVSCPTRPNTAVWVALVDRNGNIVASGSGTTDASGNATITLTAPGTTGTYRVMAIVKGSRTLL